MSKKILALFAIIMIIAVISSGYAISFFITQPLSEPEPTPTPAPSPTITPAPTSEPTSTPRPELAYDYVVYEWHLRAEHVNNVTWLNSSLATVGKPEYYNTDKTWRENYFDYLSRKETWSAQADGSLAMLHLAVSLFVDAEFNEATGWTKATYQYTEYENLIATYDIEHSLPDIADGRGWTKAFI